MRGSLFLSVAPVAGRLAAAWGNARYEVRLAGNAAEVRSALRLRHEIFHLELGHGAGAAAPDGLDHDEFDDVMEHLLVLDKRAGCVVGTYRLQCGSRARGGFYSAREFEFAPYLAQADRFLELGRACIHRDHRTATVILLLWQAIAEHAHRAGCRYLIGCSSLNSQSPADGWAAFRETERRGQLAPEPLRTVPLAGYALPEPPDGNLPLSSLPRLLRAYLGVGAKICAPPALDADFGTIDFLTLLDLESADPATPGRFLRTLEK